MSTKTLLLCLTLLLLLGAAAIGYMAFADYRWTKQHRDCQPYTAESKRRRAANVFWLRWAHYRETLLGHVGALETFALETLERYAK